MLFNIVLDNKKLILNHFNIIKCKYITHGSTIIYSKLHIFIII